MQHAALQLRTPRRLLSSCAMGLALAALGQGGAASAQVAAIQGTGVVDSGIANIDNTGGTTSAPRTNVQVFSPNAVINWTPTDTAAGATPINFLPAGGLAYFYSQSDPNFIVLNRVLPATTRQIGLNGEVRSNLDISGTTSPGGNVWFYSPTGFVAGTGSKFSTNGLILTANDIPYTAGSSAGGITFGPNGEIQMTAAAGSQANITLLPGSLISNTGANAYTLIVAPQIVQGGTIELDGSVGLIAAESVSVLIQNGLFDIDVQVGTTVANAITHTGSTGAGPTGATLAGPQQVVIMATPDSTANTALTVLLGGNLGATSVNASAADRSVILSGGYDYKGASGTGFEPDPDTTTPVNFQFGTTNFNADLTAQTTGSIIGNPSRGTAINFLGDASLTAGTTVGLTADLDETITASGDLFMKAPISATITLGTTNIEPGAGTNAARLDVAGDLTLNADNTAPPPTAATGGIARITLEAGAVGPQMTVTGNTLVTAVGTGQQPTGDGNGGAGFGGTAEILINSGTLSLGANPTPTPTPAPSPRNTTLRADGIGADGRAGNGGAGAGGTARLVANGGIVNAPGDLTISADAVGGAGIDGTFNGDVDSSAAVAQLVSAGAGTEVHTGSVTISAGALGRAADVTSNTAQAGTVDVRADTGGLLDITGPLSGSANASWTFVGPGSPTGAGITKAGSVLVTAGGGSLNTSGGTLNADAIGLDSAGAQGDVTGGVVTISAFDVPGSEGSVTFTSDGILASAVGIGAGGTSGGNGRGGAVSLIADGGVISAGTAQVTVTASGRAGQVAGAGISGTGGSFTMVSRAGGAQSGIDFGDLSIDVTGTADYSGLATADGALGQGGTVSITASGGSLSGTTITADLSGRGGNAQDAPTSTSLFTGGTGQGGTFNLLIDGGAVTLTSLDVTANGTGGTAIDAGFNSFAGNPGQGIGGSATITATAGSFSVPSLSLSANGQGGAAGSGGSFGVPSAAGAPGTGGGATIDIGGASFTTSTIALHADGIGGNGADGLPAGSGTGGLASLIATDAGAYSLGDLLITANGQAGDSSGGISPDDGTGTGGTARFVNQGTAGAAVGSRTVGSLVLQANGNGGNVSGVQGVKAVAGFVRFSDLSSGANGHASYASVSAQSVGQTAPAGTTALIESTGGVTAITNGFNVDSTGDVTISVTGNAPISAGDFVSVFSDGNIAITHTGQGTPQFATLTGNNVTVDAGQNVSAGPGTLLSASGSLVVTARTGSATLDSLTAVDSLEVHARTGVALKNATTTSTLSGSGLIYITAGNDPVELVPPFQPADITISGNVNASGQLDIHAGRDILGNGTSLLEGQTASVIAERDISGSDLTIRSRSDLALGVAGNLTVGTLDVAGLLDMVNPAGTVIQPAQLNVNGSLAVDNLILRGPTPALVRATGNLTIGSAFTTGLDVATPSGVLTLGGLQAYPNGLSGFLTASAPTISLAEIKVSGNINATATTGSVTTSNLTAGGAITLTTPTDLIATNLLQGSAVTVTAPGSMSFGTVNVTAGNFNAAPGGALSLQNATVSGAIALGGTSVTLGSAQAGGQLSVTTPGTFTANGQVSAPTVRVSSSDVVIGANGRIGTAGTTSLVQLTNNNAARRTYYGGAGNAAGYSLSGAEMGQIYGANITLVAPQTAQSSAAVPDVTIGDMTVTGAQLGAQGALTILTPGRALINGAVKFTGLTNANTFGISAGELIALDTQAGAVDLRGANNALGGRIDFSANTIVAASSAAQTALAGLTDPAAIDTVLGSNDGNLRADGVLSADSMRFSVSNSLYIQNTGISTFFPLRRGFTVGSGGFAVSTPVGRTTPVIVINGQATTSAGLGALGLDVIPLVSINGQPAPTSSGSAAGSTINGCDFTKADECRPPLTPELTLTRDRVQSPVEENSDKPSDLAVERQSLVTPGVELLDIGRFNYEPLIDEPVTGSGNDDLWVPGCDASKGNCPAP
ncbi:hypothetical protein KRR38_07815 [Novosphingobium sp. G106]|uniref:beta strand repeat-containing protein n=1 Tax=Novosphingobium sp. G106 TaxID=2849500 RepID=UPI001C2DB2E5|nr:hypothetical protein [Novosphingobium sp. G106]MBV1687588.1 hypothetical protein [Novosphingobium sp. G106]